MSLTDHHAQFEELKPRLQQVELNHLRTRLDSVQLERTITALRQTVTNEETARETEAALRRLYERAKRWED